MDETSGSRVSVFCVVEGPDGPVAAELRGEALAGAPADVAAVLLGDAARRGATPGADLGGLSDARLLAPVRPRKIVAIGLNYRDHIEEAGLQEPQAPLVFAKFPSAIVGPEQPIAIDREIAERVDWEVELAVVVGAPLRDVPVERALDHVFGYTVANDVSARDVQFADGQWVRGKSLDTFCPVGPWVATTDELPDPQALRLRTRVNGETVQDACTDKMVFGVAELLAYCSRSFTLDPGDLVLTGTPWGCGEFMTPRRSLADGDVVEVEVEGIGTLRNPVIARPAAATKP
jgi:2-keto-4-pentenoate hydratase/2-oxohepta-3-ene-1,7-dioic acid hydratase in catechol pathway